MKFTCKIIAGELVVNKAHEFKAYSAKKPNMLYSLTPLIPESRNMRGFYHGGVLSLWVYLDGADYKNGQVLEDYHEIAKQEFAFKIISTKRGIYKLPDTTKGKLGDIIEKVIEYLEEQYGIDRTKVLDPNEYKYWKDCIRPDGGPDHYIDYLRSADILK